MKVIVIGANHAGTACMNTLLDNYKSEVSVTAYDSNDNISFLGCGIALWIQGVVKDSKGLFYSSPQILEKKGANIKMHHEVLKIDEKNKTILVRNLKNNEEFEDTYDKLVIAVGSQAILPNIEGIELENVKSIKFFQDGQFALNKFKDPKIKNVCIVGAGYIGIELAEAFHKGGKTVRIIDITNDIVLRYYDKNFRDILRDKIIKSGIKLNLNEKVTQLKGNKIVNKIITNKGEYEADLVIFSIGFKPCDKIFKNLNLKKIENGAIQVDEYQRTTIHDIYAIGDCASVFDNSIEKDSYIALASNAIRSGIACGHTIGGRNLGKKLSFDGTQGSNAINVFSLCMCSTGITEEEAIKKGFKVKGVEVCDYQLPKFMPNNFTSYLKIVYEEKSHKIMGAQIVSEKDINNLIHMFSLAIFKKVKIEELKLFDMFFLPHFNQPLSYVLKAAQNVEEEIN